MRIATVWSIKSTNCFSYFISPVPYAPHRYHKGEFLLKFTQDRRLRLQW